MGRGQVIHCAPRHLLCSHSKGETTTPMACPADPTDLWHALLGEGVGVAQELVLLFCRQRRRAARPAYINQALHAQ